MTEKPPMKGSHPMSDFRTWLLAILFAAGMTAITYATLFQHFALMGG